MNRKRFIIAAIVMLLVGAGGAWWLMENHAANSAALYHRDSFLALIRDSGIQVERAAGTNAYVQFGVSQASELGIWTELGFMDVVFLPAEIEGRFTATQTGDYSWTLGGFSRPVTWDSNRPWFFLAHRNAVILTDSQELFKALRAALPGFLGP